MQNFGIDQSYIQRYIAAKSDAAARRIAEVAAEQGAGMMIMTASKFQNTDIVIMGIILIGVIGGMVSYGIIGLFKRKKKSAGNDDKPLSPEAAA